jgi:hypothetical protein
LKDGHTQTALETSGTFISHSSVLSADVYVPTAEESASDTITALAEPRTKNIQIIIVLYTRIQICNR